METFRASGRPYHRANRQFVDAIIRFWNDRLPDLRALQTQIESEHRVRYPLMKLADMYFWQSGYDAASRLPPAAIES